MELTDELTSELDRIRDRARLPVAVNITPERDQLWVELAVASHGGRCPTDPTQPTGPAWDWIEDGAVRGTWGGGQCGGCGMLGQGWRRSGPRPVEVPEPVPASPVDPLLDDDEAALYAVEVAGVDDPDVVGPDEIHEPDVRRWRLSWRGHETTIEHRHDEPGSWLAAAAEARDIVDGWATDELIEELRSWLDRQVDEIIDERRAELATMLARAVEIIEGRGWDPRTLTDAQVDELNEEEGLDIADPVSGAHSETGLYCEPGGELVAWTQINPGEDVEVGVDDLP